MTSQAWFEFSTAAGCFVTHIGINQLLLKSFWSKSSNLNIKLPSFAAIISFCEEGHGGNCRPGSKYRNTQNIPLYFHFRLLLANKDTQVNNYWVWDLTEEHLSPPLPASWVKTAFVHIYAWLVSYRDAHLCLSSTWQLFLLPPLPKDNIYYKRKQYILAWSNFVARPHSL